MARFNFKPVNNLSVRLYIINSLNAHIYLERNGYSNKVPTLQVNPKATSRIKVEISLYIFQVFGGKYKFNVNTPPYLPENIHE